jgi:hypothetical protein
VIHNKQHRTVLGKFQETQAIVYVDDGYIKAKLNVVLQVLTEIKDVLKQDADQGTPTRVVSLV